VPVEVVNRPSSGEGRTPGGMAGFAVDRVVSRRKGPEGAFEGEGVDDGPDPPGTPMLRLRNDMVVEIEGWTIFSANAELRFTAKKFCPIVKRILKPLQTEHRSTNIP